MLCQNCSAKPTHYAQSEEFENGIDWLCDEHASDNTGALYDGVLKIEPLMRRALESNWAEIDELRDAAEEAKFFASELEASIRSELEESLERIAKFRALLKKKMDSAWSK